MTTATIDLTPIERLKRDVRSASVTLSDREARFLVDTYYMMQENRKRADLQQRSLAKAEEPHSVLSWLFAQDAALEQQIRGALDVYSAAHPLGSWAREIVGVGPVLAAGLLAHIDVADTNVAGRLWSFAGLVPGVKWERGQKRPWNASLKVIAWKLGESFVKTSSHPDSFYGPLYTGRKAYEIRRNLAGELVSEAERALRERSFRADSDARPWYEGCYTVDPAERGELAALWKDDQATLKTAMARRKVAPGGGQPMLPPAHIHARAKRWTVKLFLSHYFEVGYYLRHGQRPPAAYAIGILNHADYIAPPNAPWA